jgi:farnesyl-diphosphate farnesyltransferase
VRASPSPASEDEDWRKRLRGDPLSPAEASAFAAFALGRVSRTFALNIRVLPEPLHGQVLHAYLYCRMADTLEDDATLPAPQKAALLHVFASLFDPDQTPEIRAAMARAFPTLLPPDWRTADAWEKILLARTQPLLEAFSAFPDTARHAVAACVRTMSHGMADFALRQEAAGEPERTRGALIKTMEDLDRYCWFVAGTVGVMLCDLFVEHARIPEDRASRMRALRVSFGNGLQLVNILKDVADDRARGVSWLPDALTAAEGPERAQNILIAKTLRHLEEALEYTFALPRRHRSLRLFCLWPLLMAAETLALLAENAAMAAAVPHAENRSKITRGRVARIVTLTRLLWWSDGWIRAEFRRSADRVRRALMEAPRAHTFHAA